MLYYTNFFKLQEYFGFYRIAFCLDIIKYFHEYNDNFILMNMFMRSEILSELKKWWIPNLSFFTKQESLDILPSLLEELLQVEKDKFIILLNKDNSDIKFDDFVEDSLLDYLWRILNHLDSCYSIPQLRDIISNFRPLLEDFVNEEAYSYPYYKKLLWMRDNYDLTSDQLRILELWIKNYQQRWIDLPKDKQDALKELNKQYSEQWEKFQHNLVDEQLWFSYKIYDVDSMKEMPSDLLKTLKTSDDWAYVIDADPTLLWNVLKYCSNAEIRKELYTKMQTWATDWKYDNRPVALNLLGIAKKKSEILWYNNTAEYFLWDTMAKEPETVYNFIKSISDKSLLKTKDEIDSLKTFFSLDTLLSSDISYYVRKYKEEKYALDENEIKQYFEFENTLSWLHAFVKEFMWIELRPIVNEFSGEEKWYEVYKNWKLISYYILDAFYRKGKRPWAWADVLREKNDGVIPIVFNVANLQKNNNGPTLLYLRDVETLFHEFGHALHTMFSESKYAYLSWFNIEWDFVELPSQLMENWVSDSESLSKLSKHYLTWESLPNEIIDKLQALKTFMKWYWVARQNELALVDNYFYTHSVPNDVNELDKEYLEVVNRFSPFERDINYRMYCSFLHIFWGGYEAKYYSYMWAEAYEADVFSKIKENWIFNPSIWYRYRDLILSQWARKPAKELFFDFMGRELSDDALMKRYWLE